MKIATWNINGITSRLDHVVRWCRTAEPDVLCLQETKTVDPKFPAERFQTIGFEHIEVFGEKAYNGVAIISKAPLTAVERNFPGERPDAPTRLIAASVGGIRVVNVYAPHGTAFATDKFAFKLDWFKRLRRDFDRRFKVTDAVLLCGDLNIAPHPMDVWNVPYWKDRMHFSKPEREMLQSLKQWGFVDVFRQFNDESGEYSWWDQFHHAFEKNQGLRIDHIWASPALVERCTDCWIDRDPRGWERPSDHAPVVAEFF